MEKTIASRLESTYVKAGGKGAGSIPWELLIEALMALFGGCVPKRAKRFSKMFPEATENMVVNKIKDTEGIGLSGRNLKVAAEAAVKTFGGLSDDEIDNMRGR